MGKTIITKINRFDEGIVNDVRDKRENTCRMVTNFNILDSQRMTPYRDSESGDTAPTTSQKQNFALGYWTPTPIWKIFSLGVKSGAGTAEILMKDLSDLGDGSWDTPAGNQSGSGATSFNLFVYYHRTGEFFGARAGTHIWAFTPDGSTAFNDTENALTYTNIAQGIVHSKDDICYIPYDNKIAKNNNGAWTDAALTLPEEYKVNSICEYGDYLAIGCAPLSGVGNSVVYLWDRDASLATLSESVNWGTGELKILEEVDGYLVGISHSGGATRNNDRIIFRSLFGNRARKFDEIVADVGDAALLLRKQKINNRINFLLDISIDGAEREGVWSIGRTLRNDGFVLSHDRSADNDTAVGNGALKGFFIIGDYTFISYTDTNGDFQLSKTNDAVSYTATSVYEKNFNTVDSQITKKLLSATVTTAPMPANGQIVLKYKINENITGSTWVTIFTHTTDDSIRHSAINIESSGATLPQYKEIMFRIESTGGAEVTGLKFKEEIIPDDFINYE